jgi:hypothetical protein
MAGDAPVEVGTDGLALTLADFAAPWLPREIAAARGWGRTL